MRLRRRAHPSFDDEFCDCGRTRKHRHVRLRLPELARRNHFGHGLARPQAGSIDIGDRRLGDSLLFFAGVEDRRSIRAADVVALAVASARVVNLEENLEELPEA